VHDAFRELINEYNELNSAHHNATMSEADRNKAFEEAAKDINSKEGKRMNRVTKSAIIKAAKANKSLTDGFLSETYNRHTSKVDSDGNRKSDDEK